MQIENKIKTLAELLPILERMKKQAQKIVFTNGCFDILHKGHVSYLHRSKALGDLLVLGLNSDASVKCLGKGADRPINGEKDRAFVLAGLESVDFVVIFEEETPLSLILQIMPDVLVKGGDYDPNGTNPADKKYIVGSQEVLAQGGAVHAIDFVQGFSTTETLKKINKISEK